MPVDSPGPQSYNATPPPTIVPSALTIQHVTYLSKRIGTGRKVSPTR